MKKYIWGWRAVVEINNNRFGGFITSFGVALPKSIILALTILVFIRWEWSETFHSEFAEFEVSADAFSHTDQSRFFFYLVE